MAGSLRRRRVVWAALAAAVAACLFVGLAFGSAQASAKPFWGITGQLEPEDIDAMADSGTESTAVLLPWHVVQRGGAGTFDWAKPDALAAKAADNDIELVFILFGSPAHINSTPHIAPAGKSEVDAWTTFVRASVKRYGPGGTFWAVRPGATKPVRAWQVWQEPGLRFFFQPKPNVGRYIKLLKPAAKAIRAEDPRAKILLAGLNNPSGGSNINLRGFLTRFYKKGGKGIRKHFDALSLHAYGPDNDAILRKLNLARDLMKAGGDRKKPIWVTEVGWSSDKSKHRLEVGRKGQKKKLRAGLKMLKRVKGELRIKRVLVYTWRDPQEDSACWCDSAGLLSFSGKPKPALKVYEKFAGA
ncbi:MAG: glycosyl hydrolase [Solirubrobacterales bacterium]